MTTITVDFVPTTKYGENSAYIERRAFDGANFFEACRLIAEFMKAGTYTNRFTVNIEQHKPWTDITPKLDMMEAPNRFIGGDRDSWDANPLFLEAVRSFF